MEEATIQDGRIQMNIVFGGHVDHGKSTIVGRLLADTGSLPDGKLEQIRENCERSSRPFEYAFLLDALKHEQSQGITIDTARVFFKTKLRHYIIIDAPGHIEFLKNMVSGASRAEAAFLVIDADEGIQENSKRHGYMLSMLGIKQICVLVNKMDLVDYSKVVYRKIVRKYSRFLKNIDIEKARFIPVSGREGSNIASKSEDMPWYVGKTVIEQLDSFKKEEESRNLAFRMPVQDVYKFTRFNDNRRIIAGHIASGTLKEGDKVVFYPSGKQSTVKTLEVFNRDIPEFFEAPGSAGFTLTEQIYVTRGELAVKNEEKRPEVSSRLRVNLFWMGKKPLKRNKEYIFKLGTVRAPMQVEEVLRVIDASTLNATAMKEDIQQHDVADCVLRLGKEVAFDLVESLPQTSRFVIVDDFEIRGGGIIREAMKDKSFRDRDNIRWRNYNWQISHITPEKRAERYNQQSILIVFTGPDTERKKEIAKVLEEQLFNEGKLVYFLGIGNILRGVGADIREDNKHHKEHIRRLAEVAHIFLDAGLILLITVDDLNPEELQLIKHSVNPSRLNTVWVGDEQNAEITFDLHVAGDQRAEDTVEMIKDHLREQQIIFRPF